MEVLGGQPGLERGLANAAEHVVVTGQVANGHLPGQAVSQFGEVGPGAGEVVEEVAGVEVDGHLVIPQPAGLKVERRGGSDPVDVEVVVTGNRDPHRHPPFLVIFPLYTPAAEKQKRPPGKPGRRWMQLVDPFHQGVNLLDEAEHDQAEDDADCPDGEEVRNFG